MTPSELVLYDGTWAKSGFSVHGSLSSFDYIKFADFNMDGRQDLLIETYYETESGDKNIILNIFIAVTLKNGKTYLEHKGLQITNAQWYGYKYNDTSDYSQRFIYDINNDDSPDWVMLLTSS